MVSNKNRWVASAGLVLAMAGAAFLSSTVVAGDAKPAAAASAALKIGDKAPDFTLKGFDGKEYSVSALNKEGKIVVLEWFNSECPFCVKHGEAKTIINIANDFKDKNVVVLGINSGGPGKPGYGKDEEASKKWGLNYPILQDAEGKVGRSYGAKTTPHMYIINKDGTLAYQGAIDNKPQGAADASAVNYVRQALTEMGKGEKVSTPETKPYGCGVKYAS